jgi:hypothetical protein
MSDPSSNDDSRRAWQRQATLLSATLATAAGVQVVRTRNISAGGVHIEGDIQAAAGDKVRFDSRKTGPIDGTIAWIDGNHCGIAFDQPIEVSLDAAAVALEEPRLEDYKRPGFRRSGGNSISRGGY